MEFKRKLKLFIITLAVFLCFSGCAGEKDEQLVDDLKTTLDGIISGENEKTIYLYGMGDLFEDNGNELNNLILSKIQYKVGKIEKNEENAIANIVFTIPDINSILEDVISEMNQEDADILLFKISEELERDYPSVKSGIEVSLKYMDGHWYIVPDNNLYNVFTGGIADDYFNVGMEVVENLIEGDVK